MQRNLHVLTRNKLLSTVSIILFFSNLDLTTCDLIPLILHSVFCLPIDLTYKKGGTMFFFYYLCKRNTHDMEVKFHQNDVPTHMSESKY